MLALTCGALFIRDCDSHCSNLASQTVANCQQIVAMHMQTRNTVPQSVRATTAKHAVSRPQRGVAAHAQENRASVAGLLASVGSLLTSAPALADLPSYPLSTDAVSIANDATEVAASLDPVILAAGGGIVALGGAALVLSKSLSGAKVKPTTYAKALDALSQEARVVLVDIRSKQAVREDGTPDLKAVKRKAVNVPFTEVAGEDIVPVENFVDKLFATPAIKEDSIIILLDSYGKDSPVAAKAILKEFETDTLYYITDGAEGPNGWKATGGPWKEPAPAISLPALPTIDLKNLGGNLDAFAEDFKNSPTLLKGALAVGAVVGAGALLLSEVEVVLELVGVVAAGRFLATKLLFAQDREKTFQEVKDLVQNKIKVGEAGEDLKKLATTVLDIDVDATTPAQVGANGAQPASTATNGAVVNGAAPAVTNDIAARKSEAQAWIAAWRERSKVLVNA